ncbi:DUF6602 domain-containing protein [Pseudomonas chlororaphis]|uniref:DUF6602 domain-containing protein n=1 Tax=Pseudomonas chlororaphis TaxID=587753 RepID=UPI002D79FF7F|nr:DUF6602 domain-containing protein [Pseudomonas chlororaphis]
MLSSHMSAVEERILASAKISGNSGHSLHIGSPREAFIREFLETHLPSTVAIGTGEIIDSTSSPKAPRNQFDIVIYRKDFPKLDLGGGISAFLVESVIATIEIKSTLDEQGLEQAIKAAQSAKKLKPHVFKFIQIGYALPSIVNFVVAYAGPARIETAYNWINNTYKKLNISHPQVNFPARVETPSSSIDGVFILKKGFLHFDNIPDTLTPSELRASHPYSSWVSTESEEGTLLYLFFLLTNLCVHSASFAINAAEYLPNIPKEKFKLLP